MLTTRTALTINDDREHLPQAVNLPTDLDDLRGDTTLNARVEMSAYNSKGTAYADHSFYAIIDWRRRVDAHCHCAGHCWPESSWSMSTRRSESVSPDILRIGRADSLLVVTAFERA